MTSMIDPMTDPLMNSTISTNTPKSNTPDSKKTNVSVFGIYPDRASTERAVDALKMAGFSNSDVSVLLPDSGSTKDFAHEKHTKAPEGATTGVGAGAVVGGTLGWLIGAGALAIPGVGPFIAAGPILAAMAGAGVGGAVGALTGALIGMGIPEFEAKRYEGLVKNGGILLSVHSESSELIKKAKAVLERTGAKDIASSSEASSDVKPGMRSDTSINTPGSKVSGF